MDPETMGRSSADGETLGEVMFRGNIVMKGYLHNQKATQEAFAGGWFHSGDLGVMHPDGYIQLKDRSKDIIISGGENISSIEVEDVLYKHPAVAAAAVVAKPDPKWGETPCAFVELRPGANVSEDEIIAWCKEKLARYKCPRHVVFVELPKTSTGKIQKFRLRDLAKGCEGRYAASAGARAWRSRRSLRFDQCDVVLALQIEPELRAIAEIAAEPHGRIRRDRATPVENVGDAPGWDAEVERQPVGAQPTSVNSRFRKRPGCTARTISLPFIEDDSYHPARLTPIHLARARARANLGGRGTRHTHRGQFQGDRRLRRARHRGGGGLRRQLRRVPGAWRRRLADLSARRRRDAGPGDLAADSPPGSCWRWNLRSPPISCARPWRPPGTTSPSSP